MLTAAVADHRGKRHLISNTHAFDSFAHSINTLCLPANGKLRGNVKNVDSFAVDAAMAVYGVSGGLLRVGFYLMRRTKRLANHDLRQVDA